MLWILIALLSALAAEVPRSEALMLAGDVTGALKAAEAEVDGSPDDVDANERLIDILLTLGGTQKAESMAAKRVQEAPTADHWYLLGRAQSSARDAELSYQRALKADPTHARSHMGMGAIYTARADHVGAGAAYGRAVRLDPSLREAWLGLTRSHVSRGDNQAAAEVTRKAIEAIPDAPDPYLTLAVLEPERARQVLSIGVEKAGHDPRVHAAYAQVLLDAGEARLAQEEAMAALAIDPTEPTALRVELFARQIVNKTFDTAGLKALLKADRAAMDGLVAKYPRTPVTWLTRSRMRLEAGDTDGAIADLREARKVAPDEVEVLGQLGVFLEQRGDHDEAAGLLLRAYTARPWDVSLGLGAGAAASRAGRHDEAIALLADLVKRLPYASNAAIALADALLLAGLKEEAYQVVLDAAERRTDPQILVALVAVAGQSGRYGEAAGILEQIGRATNDPKTLEIAAKLREKAGQ